MTDDRLTDRTLVLIRLLLQFVVAVGLIAFAWDATRRDQTELASLIIGAVLAAWVNEGIHAGRAASKTADQSTMTITGEATVTAPTPPDKAA